MLGMGTMRRRDGAELARAELDNWVDHSSWQGRILRELLCWLPGRCLPRRCTLQDPDDEDKESLFDILKARHRRAAPCVQGNSATPLPGSNMRATLVPPCLQANFDDIYYGNRAPMPIYVHTPWFNDDKVADLRKFVGQELVGKGRKPARPGNAASLQGAAATARTQCSDDMMQSVLSRFSCPYPSCTPRRVYPVIRGRVLGERCRWTLQQALAPSCAAQPLPACGPCTRLAPVGSAVMHSVAALCLLCPLRPRDLPL